MNVNKACFELMTNFFCLSYIFIHIILLSLHKFRLNNNNNQFFFNEETAKEGACTWFRRS